MQDIYNIFNNKNCTLLTIKIENMSQRVEYKCNIHVNSILSDTPSNVKRKKYGCPTCAKEGRAKNKRKYSIESIHKEFEEVGYTLLSKKFVSVDDRLEYVCNKHNHKTREIRYSKFKNGVRCKDCWEERRQIFHDEKRHSFEFVKNAFEERGYTLLETRYTNNKAKLKYICPIHPDAIREINLDKLLRGRGCKDCGYISSSKSQRLNKESVYNIFSSVGLTLIGKYINAHTPVETVCINNHTNMSILINAYHGHGCKMCSILGRTGENNYAWKGGVTPITRRLRADLDKWKMETLQQYNYTCQITGKKGVHLHVHHITPFHILRDEVFIELGFEDIKYSSNISYHDYVKIRDLLYLKHKDEGIPISKDLHKLFHKLYGNKCSKENFSKFKSDYIIGKYDFEGV